MSERCRTRRLSACLAAGCVLGGAPAAPAADAARGRELMAQYQCGRCHVIPAVPAAQGRLAASLEGYGRRSYIAGRVPNDAATLARWIAAPQAVKPGTPMPDLGVAAQDARDIAAYLSSLR